MQKLTTNYITPAKRPACDDVIDALLLPSNVLDTTVTPKSSDSHLFFRTWVRPIHGGTTQLIVEPRGEWIDIPNLDRAQPAIAEISRLLANQDREDERKVDLAIVTDMMILSRDR